MRGDSGKCRTGKFAESESSLWHYLRVFGALRVVYGSNPVKYFDEAKALCHHHLVVDLVGRWPLGLLSLTLALAAVGCAGERQDVLSAHEAHEGEVRVFNVGMDQAWEAARAALRWNHADTIEEHRADGYMLATAGVSGWSWGAAMGVWLEPANAQGTQVRAIVSRKLATNVFAQSEDMLLDDIAKAVALEKQGQALPDTDPE
jgi:hypothetical protein